MLPIRTSSIFRSRWMALLWAGGIIWSAVEFAGGSSADAPSANGSAAADAALGVDAEQMNQAEKLLEQLGK
jgi:hypothetical protein